MSIMASRLKKLGVGLNIDESLTTEGAECELSLADDTDEFSESFNGTLTLIADDNGNETEDQEDGDLGETNHDRMIQPESMPFVESPRRKAIPTRVSFEIVDARISKEGRSRYVAYTILVIRSPGLDTSEAMIERRYSDFEKLNSSLRKHYPSLMPDINFPKKMMTGNFRPETIAQRSRAFEQYLSHVYSIDVLRMSPGFAAFFYEKDLETAYDFIVKGKYSQAVPPLRTAMHMQQRLLGEGHPEVVATLCAIVTVCAEMEKDELAQSFAEAALQCIGPEDRSPFLVPLLQLSIRLCWKLGKDKKDLEARQMKLREAGIDVDRSPQLLDLVLHNHRALQQQQH